MFFRLLPCSAQKVVVAEYQVALLLLPLQAANRRRKGLSTGMAFMLLRDDPRPREECEEPKDVSRCCELVLHVLLYRRERIPNEYKHDNNARSLVDATIVPFFQFECRVVSSSGSRCFVAHYAQLRITLLLRGMQSELWTKVFNNLATRDFASVALTCKAF